MECLANDRNKMVLAMRVKRDRLDQDHLGIPADLAERPRELRGGIDMVSREDLLIGSRRTSRCVAKALPVGIIASPPQEHANGLFSLFACHRQCFSLIDGSGVEVAEDLVQHSSIHSW